MSTCSSTPASSDTVESPSLRLNPAFLPQQALYEAKTDEVATHPDNTGWVLAEKPFPLTTTQVAALNRLGGILVHFISAVETLYRESLAGRQPGWISHWLDQGKPEALRQYAAMKRFKPAMPVVIRPDLLITPTGFALTEIDAVPGGMGFTAMLNQAYRQSGFSVLEGQKPLPELLVDTLLSHYRLDKHARTDTPLIAVVISDEAKDYQAEWAWLVEQMQTVYPEIILTHPKALQLQGDHLAVHSETGQRKRVDVIYRFFELFDLPNIPNMELIQFAAKKGWVVVTPPFKPVHEEKLNLALLHHPILSAFWQKELGTEDFDWLRARVPYTWVMDPGPLPPTAVIADLTPDGKAVQSLEALKTLSQKGRRLVLKPSGFSPLAWGSRGVVVGHDVAQADWDTAVETALQSFPHTPYVLQTFENTSLQTIASLDPASGTVRERQVRTRLCPYYLINNGESTLAGVLATACPADKKIIHGMRDAILAPVSVQPD